MKLICGVHKYNNTSSFHTTYSGLSAVSLLYCYSSKSRKTSVSSSRITTTTNTHAAGGGPQSKSKAGGRRWDRNPSLLISCYSYSPCIPRFSSSSNNVTINRTYYNSPSKFDRSVPDAYKDSGDDPHHADRVTDSDGELDDSDSGGDIEIEIQKTGYNRRMIQSRVSIDSSLQTVWNILTDYEKLADFIPGLAVSQLLQKTDNFARLFQIGQQSLAFGLKFKAKGVIDCYEKEIQNLPFGKRRDIEFKMIEGDFQLFQGKWSVEQITTGEYDVADSIIGQEFHTNLSYVVDVEPKVWLPVHLVQGRLCREIKMNLLCIKEAAERAIEKVSGYE